MLLFFSTLLVYLGLFFDFAVTTGQSTVLFDLFAVLSHGFFGHAGYVCEHGFDHGVSALNVGVRRNCWTIFSLSELLLLLECLNFMRQLPLVCLVERLLLVNLLDRLWDLPQRIVLLPRSKRLEDHGLGSFLFGHALGIFAAIEVTLVPQAARTVVKVQFIVGILLRGDILIDLPLVEIHVSVRS